MLGILLGNNSGPDSAVMFLVRAAPLSGVAAAGRAARTGICPQILSECCRVGYQEMPLLRVCAQPRSTLLVSALRSLPRPCFAFTDGHFLES